MTAIQSRSESRADGTDWISRLAGFVSGLRWDDVPDEARATARSIFLDTVGATLAGSRDPAGRLVQAQVERAGARPCCTVVGTRLASSPELAALANGTAAHAIDIDDTSRSMDGHASISVFPVCLALGETYGRSGAALLAAFLVGYDLQGKLGSLIGANLRRAGWHSGGVSGTLGAVATAANLMGLDATRTQTALGIAASLAGGLGANIGAMAKPLHAGNAARNGILAAALAEDGFTARESALDGFLAAFTANRGVAPAACADMVGRLGRPFDIVDPGTDIKLYPCCSYTHPAIDAALAVRARLTDPLEAVERIECEIGSRGGILLGRPPTTGNEARFSFEYCVACALADQAVGPDHFADAGIGGLLPLAGRVHLIEREPASADPIHQPATVRLVLPSGEVLEETVEEPRGSAVKPLTDREIEEKYAALAAPVLDPGAVERSLKILRSLDEQSTIAPLMVCLAESAEDRPSASARGGR